MRILLVHPEDSPRRGSWSGQQWDLLVDLGQSSAFSHQDWSQHYGCPILSASTFRRGVSDAREVRDLLSAGIGYLVDEEGIDHWELTSISFVPETAIGLALQRLIAELPKNAEFWSTRSGWLTNVLTMLLGQSIRTFDQGRLAHATATAVHYADVIRRFSPGQIKEIFFDKYDPAYRWRARFARRHQKSSEGVVLVPSAYQNVSRVAAAYAELLPSQAFLMVATRRSAHQFTPPGNFQSRDLAEYARVPDETPEIAFLVERWARLRDVLDSSAILRFLLRSPLLDPAGNWLRHGIYSRDAWSEVFRREPVCGVLCGDDSNRYTRLPVVLAAKRNIATADFHHGALDGHYLIKNLPSEIYLAKSEMERDYLVRICGLVAERVVIAPPAQHPATTGNQRPEKANSIVLFSEPYETANLRAEEVYGELLPPLWKLASKHGLRLIIKLHPFESRSQRQRLLNAVLPREAVSQSRIIDGPLTTELIEQAWCGITIESTTAIECLRLGVCCFLCGWLTMSPFEYVRQFARFGVGEVLENATQIEQIPELLATFGRRPVQQAWPATDPALLQQWLTSGSAVPCGVRSAS